MSSDHIHLLVCVAFPSVASRAARAAAARTPSVLKHRDEGALGGTKHSAQIENDSFPQMRGAWWRSLGKMGGWGVSGGEIVDPPIYRDFNNPLTPAHGQRNTALGNLHPFSHTLGTLIYGARARARAAVRSRVVYVPCAFRYPVTVTDQT